MLGSRKNENIPAAIDSTSSLDTLGRTDAHLQTNVCSHHPPLHALHHSLSLLAKLASNVLLALCVVTIVF